jgi:hypothetical protein
MFGISKFKLYIAASLILFGCLAGIYTKGYLSGTAKIQTDILIDSAEAFKTRGKVNNEVNNSSDFRLCTDVGGLPDECEQLRGLAKGSKSK